MTFACWIAQITLQARTDRLMVDDIADGIDAANAILTGVNALVTQACPLSPKSIAIAIGDTLRPEHKDMKLCFQAKQRVVLFLYILPATSIGVSEITG